MFQDIKNNFDIIEGAYKKIKSLYFYSKDKLFERLKISNFESDEQLMQDTFKRLAEYLQRPTENDNVIYIKKLIKQVKYRVFPKKFKEKESSNNIITTNVKEKDLINVNFLIDMPIELMLLDCIWTLIVGKIAYDKKSISNNNYANRFQENKIFNKDKALISGIDFYSNRLFKPYFKQYTYWRTNAIECIESEYERQNDTVLISLDLKGYFYSVDFNFKYLGDLLNKDARLQEIDFLTQIIKEIYIYYTDLLSNVRSGISAQTKSGDVIFPFQMCSSCFLANLYLSAFDNKIESIKNVLYYGRYVDDIIIVFNNAGLINPDSIINEFLVKSKVLEEQENHTYGIYDTNVKVNSEKIKVFSFFAHDPRTLIDFLKDHMFVNVSSVDFFATEIANEPFENKVYYLQNNQGYSKFKDLSILQSDNYNAINYIYKLINLSKNVAVPYCGSNKSILDFYCGTASLEYKSAWVLILYLGVMQQNDEFIKKFYHTVVNEIKKLSKKELLDIPTSKKDKIIEEVKETLLEEFDIAVAIALSLNSNFTITKEKIIDYTSKIKKANMFNHYLVSYPLLNYTYEASEINFSLIETDLETIEKNGLKIDWNKIKYSPRFIHLEEINLFNFIARYYHGGNIFKNTIGENFQKFQEINKINADYPIKDEYDEDEQVENIQYKLINRRPDVQIGIASIPITKEDCLKAIQDPNWALTVENKIRVFNLLKEAMRNKAHFLVFPECYLPVAWIGEVANFAKRYNITIVTGLQYLVRDDRVYNYIANIQPFYSDRVHYRNVFMHIREKYDYSPIEKEEFAKINKHAIDSTDDIITVYDLAGQFRYCNRVCYEFTNIKSRANLRNKVELIIAPEFNQDTNYFSNIIESTARDNLCFIAQANTSIYGDSRIIGPYSTVEKNIISIKGGKNDAVLFDAVDIYALIKFKDKMKNGYSYDRANEIANGKMKFKKPPARFFEE